MIQETPIKFQLDCGATINLLPLSIAKGVFGDRYKKAIRPAESNLTLYDESVLETVGMASITVDNPKNEEKYVLDFYVTKSQCPNIRGGGLSGHDVPDYKLREYSGCDVIAVISAMVSRCDKTRICRHIHRIREI